MKLQQVFDRREKRVDGWMIKRKENRRDVFVYTLALQFVFQSVGPILPFNRFATTLGPHSRRSKRYSCTSAVRRISATDLFVRKVSPRYIGVG